MRTQAAESLGKIAADSAVRDLHNLLADPNINVQRAVLEALAEIASPESFSMLHEYMSRPGTVFVNHRSALKALAKIGNEDALEVLMEICDTEGTVEFAACKHLGETRVKQALPTLSEKLTKIEERAARWRKIRDSEREDLADHRPNRTRAFELGRAMARIDPEDTGIKLLSHDLFKVRYGAWMGLGSVGTVDLLRNIHGRRQENGDPLFQYAAYRAIDHILIYLGVQGGVEDLKALEAFYTPEVEAEEGVGTRVEWTIEQIKSRVR